MPKNSTTIGIIMSFLIGALLGSLLTVLYFSSSNPEPQITLNGLAVLDTASHQDMYLNNAIHLDGPATINGPIYLRFADDKMMNGAIGKTVSVSGSLTAVKLDNGTYVTEMTVRNTQQFGQ
ncbi:MAG: hypothetical protein ACKVP0_26460 [Pirellulaceae bacterium]